MPVLSIGGDKSLGEALGAQAKLVATQVSIAIVKNAGHWILEEQPEQTTRALLNFL
jgi:pimeloyl-ACP methyl ester carboxylesterase